MNLLVVYMQSGKIEVTLYPLLIGKRRGYRAMNRKDLVPGRAPDLYAGLAM